MISINHISVGFGHRTVLADISARLAAGRITALMGPNGCGKTTLLRCIAGLLRPDEGNVAIEGRPVLDYPARLLAQRVAFVAQHVHTDFDFTAFETVLMGRNPYLRRLQNETPADLEAVRQAMLQTGTWHLRHAHPNEMSGGELQRVMIARALAQQTPLLLMDEPVSNLDIAHQIEVMRLLRTLAKTVVIVLHDLNLALRFCDDLLLIHDGHLLYHGPIDEGLSPDRIATAYGLATHRAENHIVIDC